MILYELVDFFSVGAAHAGPFMISESWTLGTKKNLAVTVYSSEFVL